ncbi:hypothetical protein ACFFTN_01115 [Aminobacter aganoensis]
MDRRTPEQIIGSDALMQLVFEGYEVVPAVATPQMLAAGWQQLKRAHLPRLGPGPGLVEAYAAMLAAAPVSAQKDKA